MKFLKIVFLLTVVVSAYGMEELEGQMQDHREFGCHNIQGIGLIPHHSLIAVTKRKRKVPSLRILSTKNGEEQCVMISPSLPLDEGSDDPRPGPDGRSIAVGNSNGAAVVDIETQRIKHRIPKRNGNGICLSSIYFGTYESELLIKDFVFNGDRFISRYDVRSGTYVETYKDLYRCLSPDKTVGAIVTEDGESVDITLQTLWDQRTIGSYQIEKIWNRVDLVLSSDNETIALYDSTGMFEELAPFVSRVVKIVNCKSGSPVEFDTTSLTRGLRFDGSGKYVIAPLLGIEDDGRVPYNIYDSSSGQIVKTLRAMSMPNCHVSVEGSRFAADLSYGGRESILVWDFDPAGDEEDDEKGKE